MTLVQAISPFNSASNLEQASWLSIRDGKSAGLDLLGTRSYQRVVAKEPSSKDTRAIRPIMGNEGEYRLMRPTRHGSLSIKTEGQTR